MIDIRIATKDDIDCLMSIRLEMLTVVNNLPENYEHSDEQMWGAVVLSVIISFGAFLITFAAVAVGMALEGIGDKISEILAS